jgi:hypothetical protein
METQREAWDNETEIETKVKEMVTVKDKKKWKRDGETDTE